MAYHPGVGVDGLAAGIPTPILKIKLIVNLF
jgi:hypothetical protein